MSHFLEDLPHLWHGNLMKLMLTLAMLGILAVSEIKAQTGPAIIQAQAKSICNQTYTRTHQSECQPCTFSGSLCHPGSSLVSIQYCPKVGDGFDTCRVTCEEKYTEKCCHGFWGDDCSQECPGGSLNPCNGQGKCSGENGQCVCEAGFKGTSCELCTNEAQIWPDCSLEAGVIIPTQAERFCKQTYKRNYQTGCRSCSYFGSPCRAGYTSGSYQFNCGGVEGMCNFVCEEDYSPEYCCHGFWGDGCIQECPGGSGNPCNGHGECSTKNGECLCKPGFAGQACELCTNVNKYGPDCSLEFAMYASTKAGKIALAQAKRVCNHTHKSRHQSECQPCVFKHSECYPGSTYAVLQHCPKVGDGFDTCRVTCETEYTEKCCLGFWGDDCSQECPGGSVNPCNGHGNCSSTNGQCLCEAGFNGTSCELCTNGAQIWPDCSLEAGVIIPTQAERFCKQTYKRNYETGCRSCSYFGSPCLAGYTSGSYQFNCGGVEGMCNFVCEEDYSPEYCCHGFWGDGCIQECPGGSGNPCNGRGECSTKNGECLCKPGFKGEACELCANENKFGPDCSLEFKKHAFLKSANQFMIMPAQPKPVCKQTYKRTHQSECQACVFRGNACYPGSVRVSTQHCPKVGDGFDTCRFTCEEKYTEKCCLGFWGDDCSQECPGGSVNPCNGHGNCSSKNGQCLCEAGFKGTSCELCTNEAQIWPDCSLEAGVIIPTQAERFCKQTYKRNYQTGCRSCSYFGSPCRAGYKDGAYEFNCGGVEGQCNFVCEEEYSPEYCCHGFWGDGCIQECPGGSRNPCNGHGECSRKDGQCYCEPGFEGKACELCTNVNKYGPNCSLDCNCEDGACNNGINGDGFCKQCPGGSENPCNGHGYCFKEEGRCLCEPGFEGPACELCTNVNKYGPDCSLDCICEDGECNNGINGDGLCKPKNPCQSSVNPCGNNSRCIHTGPGKHACVCNYGYAEEGTECVLINHCLKNKGGCDNTTDCVHIAPYQSTCQCKAGYDRYIPGQGCSVQDLCGYGDRCGANSVCKTTEPYTISCTCKEGYKSVGKDCVENEKQETALELIKNQLDNSTLSSNIMEMCTVTKEGKRKCTCPEHLVGDGITCRERTIAEEILENPELAMLGRIMKVVKDYKNILGVVNGSYTFFAPDNRSLMKKFKKHKNSLKYWSQEDNALSFLKFHTVSDAFSREELTTSDGIIQSYPTLYDGYSLHIENVKRNMYIYTSHSKPALIRSRSISAVNGVIHMINQVLVPLRPENQEPTFKTLLLRQPKYKLFYKALKETNVLETLSSLEEYTLFVLPNDVVKQMKTNITADFLKYHILPQRVSSNGMSDKTEKETILGSRYRLSAKRLGRKAYVNEVEITRPNMWTDVGVLHEVSEFLRPVNSRCDENNDATAVKPECCGGYFGPACLQGPEDPCSGNGVWSDGDLGSGICKCNPGFLGERCEDTDIELP